MTTEATTYNPLLEKLKNRKHILSVDMFEEVDEDGNEYMLLDIETDLELDPELDAFNHLIGDVGEILLELKCDEAIISNGKDCTRVQSF